MTEDRKPSVILLDIEGTTTPISFVYETLFPYARAHLKRLLAEHANDAELRCDLEQLLKENEAEKSSDAPRILQGCLPLQAFEYLVWLMDRDRKSTALKSIQGKIWQTGYASGELRSTIFADVPIAFERWDKEGRRVAIYSSGSMHAQRLLFQYSSVGDLTKWISAYFDTTSGAKTEAASYSRIAEALGVEPQEILFLSDSPAEINAARSAGIDVRFVVRSGNHSTPAAMRDLPCYSFDDL